MTKNTPEAYKKRIREKYEAEKQEVHAAVFLNPSRAKLRKLCFELFKDNDNPDDLKIFESFFKFKFSLDCSKKLKEETDKFRPIEKFLKGETEPADLETVNMAAILVDFQPRPFLKFSKTAVGNAIDSSEQATGPEVVVPDSNSVKSFATPNKTTLSQQSISTVTKKRINKKRVFVLVAAVILGMGFSVKHFFFAEKQCLEWHKDHYVVVDCASETHGLVRIPYDKSLTDFRRIWPCDTTTFFKDGKAVLWYCKSGNEIELYNKPGFDPVFEKPLKAITPYMMDKYCK